MTETVATTQCSKPECQAANSLDNKFCEQCGTPLLKRYLWPLGNWIESYQVGQLIDERYLLKAEKIVLDTKPGIPPTFNEDIPDKLRNYLRLFPYRLHLPQIYSYYSLISEPETVEETPPPVTEETPPPVTEETPPPVTEETSPKKAKKKKSRKPPRILLQEFDPAAVCLLEYGTIPLDEAGEPCYPTLLPQLTEVWADYQDNPLRQLNWLWQMAKLWQPLEGQRMVSSLLNPFLVRVNGGNIQLLELHKDEHNYHSIKELGQFWLSLVDDASPLIVDYLKTLCEYLQRGKIPHPEYLLHYFDNALTYCGQWYELQYQIFTQTDAGPTRHHNEDACYPQSGEFNQPSPEFPNFTLVCDGVGGQDGGEIASQLAIDTLVQEIPKLPVFRESWNSQHCLQQLGEVIALTNNLISKRNDAEHRQDRQRMGTTLVLTLARGPEIYLAHVGDSRIYQITTTGCHQVTIDDDLASREVRLGYLFYRDAIKYPNSGALVQALGMSNSTNLHPNVERLIIDEDCIFLLCSDGLSDYDRIDQYWDSEIAPILKEKKDLSTVGKQLIELANEKNGHDNVTIGLVYCQVKLTNLNPTPLMMAAIETSLASLTEGEPTEDSLDDTSQDLIPTEPLSPSAVAQPQPQKISPLLLSAFGLLILIIAAGAYGFGQLFKPNDTPSPNPSPSNSVISPVRPNSGK
ncbi:PP2C family serine/threonine-protein phosphatase [Crocosphaera sp. UHCC 0190]|uniref:PP2C family serine/threonine-protein phosphatase n=1 Tax=Crocosphaera sp. UHCC 0190 TaxID=3110246 RepID=UPI002B20C1B2|nr:PP2C family serine/threonine-protein phosphatase [Crocosphaera sp. UHCC 0190]MEA5511096.1 PP2C family serine/threonine-protein phosphatase [Crocosphaera sp. UHCC 0190]